MPELPDLVHIEKVLQTALAGRTVTGATVREPVVLRVAVPGGFAGALSGRRLEGVRRHGPFLVLDLPPLELVVHFMLAGRFRLGPEPGRPARGLCFTLELSGGGRQDYLDYLDDRRMGKVYLVAQGEHAGIPGFDAQGVDVLSEAFTLETFRGLLTGRRQQVRVFLMDQGALSAIGNAYADEILFASRLHPKTPCHSLGAEQVENLYRAIRKVLAWGIEQVERAGEPLEVKVRGHLKVRGRLGEPCPVCGTTIRRVGVLGYDAFFCPRCQATPQIRYPKIPWK
jgi:formamidopyrimidine-DNA glycosylase